MSGLDAISAPSEGGISAAANPSGFLPTDLHTLLCSTLSSFFLVTNSGKVIRFFASLSHHFSFLTLHCSHTIVGEATF